MIFNKIKSICHEKGISVAKLEREAHIGKHSIYRWNTVSPSVENLKAVADVLNVTLDELVGD